MRISTLPVLTVISIFLSGCSFENNPKPTSSEAQTLSSIIQLTSNFNAAGEAYFSQDMRWIVFQAIPAGGAQRQYQMYVAPVKRGASGITGIGLPLRISPID